MCYMCTQEYQDWQDFLEETRKQLRDTSLDRFKASDTPILYALYARTDYDAERLLSRDKLKELVHRVLGPK